MKRMDFDIGSLLYILVTVVVVILGLTGKRRKRTPAQGTASGEKAETPGFMENLEKILQMGVTEPATPPEIEEEDQVLEYSDQGFLQAEAATDPPQSAQPAFQEYMDRLDAMNRFDGDRILPMEEGEGEKLEVIDLDAKEGTDYFDIVRNFDPGTAIVYAAIINRIDY